MGTRSTRCINCKKYLGKFSNLPDGTTDDGTHLYCNNECYKEFQEKVGVREGKTFIEFQDSFGWTTRVNLRRNPLDIEIKQKTKGCNRYVYLKAKETDLLLKKIKEFALVGEGVE